jgi:hypothetical protein
MNAPVVWPDLSVDRQAMEKAREMLGETAGVSELLLLAQKIKDDINKEKK